MKKAKYKAVTFCTPQQLYKALYSGRVIIAPTISLSSGKVLREGITLYEEDCKIYPEGVDVAKVFLENNRFTEVTEEEVHWEDSLGTDKYKKGILCEVSDGTGAAYEVITEYEWVGYLGLLRWDNARPLTKEEALSMVYTEDGPITDGRPWHKGGHITGYE